MTEVNHHGFRVLQSDTTYSPIETTDTSTIGLIYTAPDADPDLHPLNKPELFLADRYNAASLGAAGTVLAGIVGGAITKRDQIDAAAWPPKTLT